MTGSKTTVPSPHNDPLVASRLNASNGAPGVDIEQYRASVPLYKRVWQHSLTQMVLLSIQSFCGPAMSDAITGESAIPTLKSSEYAINHF